MSEGTPFKIQTLRFGELEITESDIITTDEGLLGFPEAHRYVLVSDPRQSPFLWLQSADEPDLAFVIVNPLIFFPGYQVSAKPEELGSLGLDEISQATILTIVVIPPDPMDITTNLRGPLIINPENNKAKQLVLVDDRYHTKHFLLRDIPPELAGAPSEAVGEQR
jgi:flagellar assembly factor FliW